MYKHRITMSWLDRWASYGPELKHLEFTGTDEEILAILDKHEAEMLPVVAIVIDTPCPHARDAYKWEATLSVDGDLAVVMTNGGNWLVGVEPVFESSSSVVELRDPYGQHREESADVVISRDLAFAGLRAWLEGRENSIMGLKWELYRQRDLG